MRKHRTNWHSKGSNWLVSLRDHLQILCSANLAGNVGLRNSNTKITRIETAGNSNPLKMTIYLLCLYRHLRLVNYFSVFTIFLK